MSSLQQIKGRIQTLKTTRQITATMKMTALARLKKDHQKLLDAEPYISEMNRAIRRLIRSATARQTQIIEQGEAQLLPMPPLLKGNGKDDRYLLVVITSDDGLSGSSNIQVIAKTQEVISYVESRGKTIQILAFGTRGAKILKRLYRDRTIHVLPRKVLKNAESYLDAERLALDLMTAFTDHRFDVCLMIYNQFQSMVAQSPTIDQVIPNKLFFQKNPWQFLIDTVPGYKDQNIMGDQKISVKHAGLFKAINRLERVRVFGALDEDLLVAQTRPPDAYDYEPSDLGILQSVLTQYFVAYMNYVLLAAQVSDNAARLIAMENATHNADDMMARMEWIYRRGRQNKITTQTAEIASGAVIK